MMAIRMKASNDFHSTTSSNFFLIGFLSPIHQRAYGSLSMGGLAPTLLAVFFTSAGGSPLATGGSPLGWPGSFPVPLCGESSMLTLSSVAPVWSLIHILLGWTSVVTLSVHVGASLYMFHHDRGCTQSQCPLFPLVTGRLEEIVS